MERIVNKKKIIIVVSVLLMLASIGVLLSLAVKTPPSQQQDVNAVEQQSTSAEVNVSAPIFTTGPLSKLPTDEQQLAKALLERFGDKLNQPYWRIRAIESLIKFLQKKYPNDWQLRIKGLLAQLFPEQKDLLLASLESYNRYNDWLKMSQNTMTYSSKEERLRAIWDKRVQFFGEDAYVIWEQQFKQEKVEKSLAIIDKNNQPLTQKIKAYGQTLTDVYGQEALDPNQSHPVQLMESFLKLESVQNDLHRQSVEQQKQSLRQLRMTLGLKEDALQRLETLDDKRAERFSTGEQYETQRAALEKQLTGQSLELQKQALQNRLFGAEEAQFIRNEEASGYFRYKEKQVIGVN